MGDMGVGPDAKTDGTGLVSPTGVPIAPIDVEESGISYQRVAISGEELSGVPSKPFRHLPAVQRSPIADPNRGCGGGRD